MSCHNKGWKIVCLTQIVSEDEIVSDFTLWLEYNRSCRFKARRQNQKIAFFPPKPLPTGYRACALSPFAVSLTPTPTLIFSPFPTKETHAVTLNLHGTLPSIKTTPYPRICSAAADNYYRTRQKRWEFASSTSTRAMIIISLK